MLRRIGYIKPMPKPGKSLLKKSKEGNYNFLNFNYYKSIICLKFILRLSFLKTQKFNF